MKKLLLSILLLAAFNVNAALIFKSNFGPGVTLAAPTNYFPTGNGAWRLITGTDKETGYTWPPKIGGISQAGLQIITRSQLTPLTIGSFYEAGIRQVPEIELPFRELYQVMKDPGVAGDCCDQIPFILQGGWSSGDIDEVYITYLFKHQANLQSQLNANVANGNWRTQFEFKTGGYNNTGNGDYRIITNIIKDGSGKLYWSTVGDNKANQPEAPVQYWRQANNVVPVPIDKWFKYEVYWKRSTGTDGRFWSAVNGQVIVDRFGPNKGKYNLPITRIMLNNAYSGGQNPTQSRMTGLEMHSTWPCGVGVSCYGK